MASESINAAVEAAFDAETKAEETPTVETPATDTPVEQPAQTEQQAATSESAEAQTAETPAEQPAETPTVESAPAPQQLKGDFAKNKWGALDKETQDELSRLCTENERNYKRAAEAEYQNRDLRKKLEPVQGYISEVAESAKITEADVMRNCVEIIQNLNDKPDLTARQMIAGDMIRFTDPVAVIHEIAHRYGIDLKGEMIPRDIPVSTQVDAARAKYEARQSKYVQPHDDEAEHMQAISEYVESVPNIKALYTSEATRDKFIRQIAMERHEDPYASDITIINRAAEMFPNVPVQETPAQPTPTVAEQKLSKVVAPKASTPADIPADRKPDEWTPENVGRKSAAAAVDSVRAAMRSLGLDD